MKRTLHKTSTSLALAIAAFAVTASGAYAFHNQELLTKAGLTDEQVVAVQEARELRRMGDKESARDVLVSAGIDLQALHELRQQHRAEHRADRPDRPDRSAGERPGKHRITNQINEKLTPEQQDALMVARQANDRETIRAILDDAGVERPGR